MKRSLSDCLLTTYLYEILTSKYILIGCVSSNDWLETVATEYVTWKFEAFPETATSLGEHKYDANLNQYTTEAFQNNKVGRTSVKLTTETF